MQFSTVSFMVPIKLCLMEQYLCESVMVWVVGSDLYLKGLSDLHILYSLVSIKTEFKMNSVLIMECLIRIFVWTITFALYGRNLRTERTKVPHHWTESVAVLTGERYGISLMDKSLMKTF